MADRFERRYSLPENLYIEGSPVVIVAGALLKDTITGKMLAQIKLRNIWLNNIQAVKVKLKAYEPNGDEIDGVEEFQYIDLNAGHGDEFGQKTPIYFPNNSTRKFDICVTEVVLNGTEPWVSDTVEWKPLPAQELIYHSINNTELEKQYKIEVGEGNRADQTPKYIPDITLDLFRCTCGDINPESSTVCLTCGRNKDLEFKSTDVEMLKEKSDIRVKEEKELSEKKVQELAEKKEKAKKTYVKVGIIAGIVLVIIIGAVVVFNNYRRAEIINNSAELITKNTWKNLDDPKKIVSLNKNGGKYGEYEVSSWDYKAPVLRITYIRYNPYYSSYYIKYMEKEKVKLTLSWLSGDILQLTTDGGKERFVIKSQYDEAIKIKKE
jgi:sRNA-binding regulator protein Hfq